MHCSSFTVTCQDCFLVGNRCLGHRLGPTILEITKRSNGQTADCIAWTKVHGPLSAIFARHVIDDLQVAMPTTSIAPVSTSNWNSMLRFAQSKQRACCEQERKCLHSDSALNTKRASRCQRSCSCAYVPACKIWTPPLYICTPPHFSAYTANRYKNI